jgi:hypothetical protein
MPKGDCYEANGRFITNKISLGDNSGWVLCHGVAILQTDGKPFGHAWVEKGSTVYDKSNNKDIQLAKRLYYALGQIPVKGHKIYRYTPEKAAIKMVKNKHWGPWDSKPMR